MGNVKRKYEHLGKFEVLFEDIEKILSQEERDREIPKNENYSQFLVFLENVRQGALGQLNVDGKSLIAKLIEKVQMAQKQTIISDKETSSSVLMNGLENKMNENTKGSEIDLERFSTETWPRMQAYLDDRLPNKEISGEELRELLRYTRDLGNVLSPEASQKFVDRFTDFVIKHKKIDDVVSEKTKERVARKGGDFIEYWKKNGEPPVYEQSKLAELFL